MNKPLETIANCSTDVSLSDTKMATPVVHDMLVAALKEMLAARMAVTFAGEGASPELQRRLAVANREFTKARDAATVVSAVRGRLEEAQALASDAAAQWQFAQPLKLAA